MARDMPRRTRTRPCGPVGYKSGKFMMTTSRHIVVAGWYYLCKLHSAGSGPASKYTSQFSHGSRKGGFGCAVSDACRAPHAEHYKIHERLSVNTVAAVVAHARKGPLQVRIRLAVSVACRAPHTLNKQTPDYNKVHHWSVNYDKIPKRCLFNSATLQK